jgi:hypothetical protein
MSLPQKWVSVDPGEMTGYAVWTGNKLVTASAAPLWDFVMTMGHLLLPGGAPLRRVDLWDVANDWKLLVMEDWALYPWSAEKIGWDKQDTVRGIGALQFIAEALGRPYVLQPAKIKERAMSAGAGALFRRPLKPNRHANDAIMHGVYYAASAGEGVAEVS